jgi:hypothetical protein
MFTKLSLLRTNKLFLSVSNLGIHKKTLPLVSGFFDEVVHHVHLGQQNDIVLYLLVAGRVRIITTCTNIVNKSKLANTLSGVWTHWIPTSTDAS